MRWGRGREKGTVPELLGIIAVLWAVCITSVRHEKPGTFCKIVYAVAFVAAAWLAYLAVGGMYWLGAPSAFWPLHLLTGIWCFPPVFIAGVGIWKRLPPRGISFPVPRVGARIPE